MKAYKGFDKDLKCRDFQYEEGKTYKVDESPVRCGDHGFHSCENPLDVFGYYAPGTSVFHEVEVGGEVDRDDADTKIASQQISIGKPISIKDICELAVKLIGSKLDWSKGEKHATGDYSASAATGHQSASAATGYQSASAATGERSVSLATGDNSRSEILPGENTKNAIAITTGIGSKASAPLGCWIVCAEWKENTIVDIKRAKVDGKKIKENTWYTVKRGKFVKV